LIGQPAKRRERHHPIRPDHNETAKAMSYTWQSGFVSDSTDPVLNNQVSAINMDLDAVAE